MSASDNQPSRMRMEISEIPQAASRLIDGSASAVSAIGARLREIDPVFVTTIARGSSDHAAALQALARLFMVTLPARGVLALGDDLCQNIDDIAARHLDRATAEKQFTVAVSRIDNVQQRDAIETAHANIVNISELAHYYAGLAAGITLAELATPLR